MKIINIKALVIVCLLLLTVITKVKAQGTNIDMPKIVVEAFESKYPLAVAANWRKLNSETYEVGFIMRENKYESIFTAVGEWKSTGMIINFDDLPETVSTEFKARFHAVEIVEAMEIKSKKYNILYSVEFKSGLEMKEAFFNEKGGYIKLENETSEEIK